MSVASSPTSPARGIPRTGAAGSGPARVIGVDVARGLALLGMFAVHIFDTLHADNTPSKTFVLLGGHALATFVLLAGVSLTFITKRNTGPLLPDAAALATRALFITVIGLALNSALDPDIEVILPYYGLMFLFAIPLIRRSSRVLVVISIGLVLVAPLLVVATFGTNLPSDEPSLATLAHPVAFFAPLLATGSYPVVAYMAFICVGMVLGRLDLSDRVVAVRIAVVGVVLSAAAWMLSTLILFHLGGLQHLRAQAPSGVGPHAARNIVLWAPADASGSGMDPVSTWWFLTERAPYAATPFRMVHDIGLAMAVLGISLLVTRSRRMRRLVGPLAAAGAMTLTLYTAHVIVLSTPVLNTDQVTTFLVLAYAAVGFAALWRQGGRRGPLEAAVAWSCARARRLAEAVTPAGQRPIRHR